MKKTDLFKGPEVDAYNRNARELGVLSVKVTPFYRSKIAEEVCVLGHTNGPLARTALPIPGRFDARAPMEVDDFVDDRANMPEGAADSIVRKYTGRMLFFPTDNCAGHCTYCFRTDVLADQHERKLPSLDEKIDTLLAYLAEHPEVNEVILSGGDPMTLPTRQLVHILGKLKNEARVPNVRVHTRTLAFAPKVYDEERAEALAEHRVRLVHHIVHPYEVCDEVRGKIDLLNDKGVRMYNQFPLLRQVNDHPEVLTRLLTMLDDMDIRNLSMFIPDPIKYSAVFRIRLERLFRMIDEMNWGTASWVNSTRTVLDTHHGKVRREDFKGYDASRNVAIFEREGHVIEYPDLPEAMDEPGDINTLLWKK